MTTINFAFGQCLRHAFLSGAGYKGYDKITGADLLRWVDYGPPKTGSFAMMADIGEYKVWYDEAMLASNEAGYSCISAAETIRILDAENTKLLDIIKKNWCGRYWRAVTDDHAAEIKSVIP